MYASSDGVDAMVVDDPRSSDILDIFAKETGADRDLLVPEAVISDLEVASLDLVQTIFAIEEKYKVDIPVASAESGAEFQTVGDLVRHVLATLDAAQPGPHAG